MPERQTVEQFLTRWLEEAARPTVRPRTLEGYAIIVHRHLVPSLGRHRLTRLNPQHVQHLMTSKLSEGLSPRTVRSIHAVLRIALNQAVRWDLIFRNAASLVTPPRSESVEVTPLTPEQAAYSSRPLGEVGWRLSMAWRSPLAYAAVRRWGCSGRTWTWMPARLP